MRKVNLNQVIDINKISSSSKPAHRKNKEIEKALLELRKEFEKPYQNAFRTLKDIEYKYFERITPNCKIRNNSFLLYVILKLPYYKKQNKSWKDKVQNILEWLKFIISFLGTVSIFV